MKEISSDLLATNISEFCTNVTVSDEYDFQTLDSRSRQTRKFQEMLFFACKTKKTEIDTQLKH